ncbi:hypothetical protein KY345_04505 [Candidatus Woesearchaeota archaeon]|nr:hypothetical protein [Candidatus Woesearchaeota archaeon]
MLKKEGKEVILNKLSELEESELLELYLEHLKKQNKLTEIPITLFRYDLSPSELIIKYLKENLGLSTPKIAKLLNRNSGAILNSYNNANNKYPSGLFAKETNVNIPIEILANRNYSILENITIFLKEIKELKIKEISSLLNKNPKTISTVYRRAKNKRGEAW